MNLKACAFDASPLPTVVLDRKLVIQACNEAYMRTVECEEALLVGRPLIGDIIDTGCEIISASLKRVLSTEKPDVVPASQHFVQKTNQDMGQKPRRGFSNIPIFNKDGELEAILHCLSDIGAMTSSQPFGLFGPPHSTAAGEIEKSLNRDIQRAIEAERDRIRQVFKQAPGFICLLRGPQHIYELANDAYYQLIGHRDIIGFPLRDVLPEVIAQGFLDKLDRAYETGEPFIGRAVPIQLQRDTDDEMAQCYIDLIYQPMRDVDGTVTGIFVQGHDVTEAHELAREVSFQAAHDPLTSLINRREFARLTRGLDVQRSHALVYVDLDHFKIINDRCGHAAGDALLIEVARALEKQCSDNDILARLGGDEFALVRPNSSLDEIAHLADRMRHAVKGINFMWQGKRHGVTLSAGVAAFGSYEDLPFDEALGLADAACFLAKEKGRDQVRVSRRSDEEIKQQQTDMDGVTRLKDALREDRIVLYGQKIIALLEDQSDEQIFYEVLARIIDDDGTVVGPGKFIPAAERFGLIQEVDRHILTKAFAHLHDLHPGERLNKCLFINLSGITLSTPGFSTFIDNLLIEFHGVTPSQICFEITETVAISNISRTANAMHGLIAKGFSFALDDFGSGMASFTYLHHLPVQFVKIDGEFVKAIGTHPAGSVIVEAVVKIAKTMNMRTIAESVESKEFLPRLRALGLDYGQGFALHRPQPL